MKADRELLELAAKAAGLPMHRYCEAWKAMARYTLQDGYHGPSWNPLLDDGDALRLLVKVSGAGEGLRLMLPELHDPWAVIDDYTPDFKVRECNDDDPYAATRRAIVLAAAAIGEAMP